MHLIVESSVFNTRVRNLISLHLFVRTQLKFFLNFVTVPEYQREIHMLEREVGPYPAWRQVHYLHIEDI